MGSSGYVLLFQHLHIPRLSVNFLRRFSFSRSRFRSFSIGVQVVFFTLDTVLDIMLAIHGRCCRRPGTYTTSARALTRSRFISCFWGVTVFLASCLSFFGWYLGSVFLLLFASFQVSYNTHKVPYYPGTWK